MAGRRKYSRLFVSLFNFSLTEFLGERRIQRRTSFQERRLTPSRIHHKEAHLAFARWALNFH